MGGLMSITGEADSEPGGGPQKVGIAIADVITGMYSTIAILAALSSRDQTGLGQYIDMALLDSIIALGGNQITGYFANGKVPFRYGNAHASLVPYQVFAVKDGEIVIAVGNDTQWQRYCEAIKRPDLAQDPKWEKVTGRITGRSELIPHLAKTMLERNRDDWISILESYDVPCGPINNYQQVFEDPHVIHREIKVDTPYEDGSIISTIASPLRLQSTPPEYKRPPPKLGDSNFEILNQLLGYSVESIEQLKDEKII
jgi:crotonobetainyl-CoA:carnitine CoA-transferase CaiB-like acyl-CoA transferase